MPAKLSVERKTCLCVLAWLILGALSATAQEPIEAAPEAERAANRAIREALARLISLEIIEQPLSAALVQVAQAAEINLRLDQRALDDIGVLHDAPVTFVWKNAPLHSALRLQLAELDLTWVVQGGMLIVTTKARQEEQLSTIVYPVADLAKAAPNEDASKPYRALIKAIQSTVQPDSWGHDRGPTMVSVLSSQALVVLHTEECHHQIEGLLSALRAARQSQAVEAERPK